MQIDVSARHHSKARDSIEESSESVSNLTLEIQSQIPKQSALSFSTLFGILTALSLPKYTTIERPSKSIRKFFHTLKCRFSSETERTGNLPSLIPKRLNFSRAGGRQMAKNRAHKQNAESSMQHSREPDSKVTDDRDSHS
jgi:hypothetical protein